MMQLINNYAQDQVLLTVDICNTEVSCENTYGKLLPVFRNKSTHLSVRTLIYELFLKISQKFKFEEAVLFVLKTDEDLRLKSHIAHNLKSLFENALFFKEGEKSRFIKSMKKLLEENELSLDRIIHESRAKSVSDNKTFSMNFPFPWVEFNLESYYSNVYDSIHNYLKNTLISQMFHRLLYIFEFGVGGNGLFDLSFDDIKDMSSKLFETQTLMRNFERGLIYNLTKVVKLFEAHHQLPTIIGLPLKWSTEATLVFSLRSGLEVDFNSDKFEFHAEAICRPSAAVTVLNQVVMDFTSVTQIGVLSNFSGYSAIVGKAKLNYTEKKKVFSFEKPPKTQKILELL
ncbi:uncharacterized protein TNCV_214971 [Trichonephila clavipes]|nr:uncharacterized protein TNCV_214971 [Trichonephila clavipes]